MHPAPIVGTFHAAGAVVELPGLRPVAALARRAHRPQGRRVQGRPRARPALPRRGVRHPVQRRRDRPTIASTPPTPTSGPTIFFCGRHEERKGLAVLLEAFAHAARRRPAVDRQRRARRPAAARRARRRRRASSGSGGSATPRSSPACAGADVFCAPSLHGESFGVVLIEAMAAGTPVVASGIDGYRNVATDGVDAAARRARRRRRAGRRRSAPVLDDRAARRVAARGRRTAGPRTSR